MTLSVVILAGGLATRLRPITEHIPKSLVEVVGKPFAIHQIELLCRYGLTDIVFCVGHLGEQVQRVLGDGRPWGVRLRYVFDGPALVGTGGAVRKALPLLSEEFLVLYGDSYLECDYQEVARAFRDARKMGLMTVLRNSNLWDRSNVLFERGEIKDYDKCSPSPKMQHIDYGLGMFCKRAFEPYTGDEAIDLARIYRDLLDRDQLAALEVTQRFYEIGSPTGLEETRRHLQTRLGLVPRKQC